MTSFGGCFVATLTPFTHGNRVDINTLAEHVSWLIDEGTDGICPAGTTGEFLYLSETEMQEVIAQTVRAAAGRVPVIAGVWAPTLEGACRLAAGAEVSGADAVFLPPPIYYPASDNAMMCWYRGVKNASSLPVMAYNIPQYAANTISFDCLDRLFSEGIIAGVKDSSGNTERVAGLIERYGCKYPVFAASDGFASKGRELGAQGFISAIANWMPSTFARLWAGDASVQPIVDHVRTQLKAFGSISALKYLLTRKGYPFGESRIPCSTLTDSQKTVLNSVFDEILGEQ